MPDSTLTITTTSFEIVAGVSTLLALGVEGAVGAVTWELTDVPHALPTGMQLTAQGIVGAPNQIGRFDVKVTATDRLEPFPQSATARVEVTVVAPDPEEAVEAEAPPPPEQLAPASAEGDATWTSAPTVSDVTATQPAEGAPVVEPAPETAEVAPGAQIVTPGAAAPTQGL